MSDEIKRYDENQDNNSDRDDINNSEIMPSVSHSNNEGNASYSFWAEQIASYTQSDNRNSDPYNENNCKTSYQDMEVIDGISQDSGESNTAKRKSRFVTRLVKGILCAAIFGIVAGAAFIGVNTVYYSLNPNAAPFSINFATIYYRNNDNRLNLITPKDEEKKLSATTVSSEIIEQKTDITDVVDATMPSIVTITSTFTQNYNWFGQQGSENVDGGGSGIIVGKNDTELLIATNNHVVEGANTIKVSFIDDSQAEAIIKGTDAIADLAVISIKLSDISAVSLNAIQIAKLGDSENVKVGEMAIAIGNALGYGQSTTVGYISAKEREVAVSDKTMVLLQTDAAINPGNSGGALLNINGEVIGINTVKYASSEVEGMGFAIPISRAMPIINELMNREILTEEEKGYLGVYIDDVTEEISTFYNWPIGVYVKSIIEGGAAEKAGLVSGDIIVGVNGTEITSSTQLKEKVNAYRHGTEVTLKIMRNKNGEYVEVEIPVILGKSSTIPTE